MILKKSAAEAMCSAEWWIHEDSCKCTLAAGLDNHHRSFWRIKHEDNEEKSDLEFEETNGIQIYESRFSTNLFLLR